MKKQLEGLIDENGTIRCAVCKSFLSVPPIVSHEILGSVCGREHCKKYANSKGNSYRQSAYEEIAKFLNFSCSYKEEGCKEKIPWDSVQEHEKQCEFSKMQCPFSMEKFDHENGGACKWNGVTQDFLGHLEDEHSHYRFNGSVTIQVDNDFKNKFVFSKIGLDIVILLISVDEKSVYLRVWAGPENLGNIKYNIEVLTKEGKLLTASENHYPKLMHASIFKTPINSSWFILNFDCIKSFFKNLSLIRINFYNNDIIVIDQSDALQSQPANMFENIKCDICNKEVDDDIYFCKNLHNSCKNCKTSSVSSVTSPFGQGFNPNSLTAKSNVSTNAIIVSKYNFDEKLRCAFCNINGLYRNVVFQSLKVVANQNMKSCRLCNEKVGSLSSHFKETHWGDIFQLNKKIPFLVKQCIFFFDAHAFLLQKYFSADGALSFSVESLGTPNISYKYELQISSKISYSAMTFTDICFPENRYREQIFGKNMPISNTTYVPLELLSKISPEIKSIEFTLNITKLNN